MSKWKNVEGSIVVNLYFDGISYFCHETGSFVLDGSSRTVRKNEIISRASRDTILALTKEKEIEVVLHFLSSGYSLAMSMYGGADYLGWEAEHEDERLLDYAEIETPTGIKELPALVAEELFELFLDEINEVELSTEADEPPERERDE